MPALHFHLCLTRPLCGALYRLPPILRALRALHLALCCIAPALILAAQRAQCDSHINPPPTPMMAPPHHPATNSDIISIATIITAVLTAPPLGSVTPSPCPSVPFIAHTSGAPPLLARVGSLLVLADSPRRPALAPAPVCMGVVGGGRYG